MNYNFEKLIPFWDNLNDNEKNSLLSNTVLSKYSKGQVIHGKDSECIGILIVKSGSLRVYILSSDGREVTLFHLNPGDFCVLSASCIIDAVNFDINIDASRDTEAYNISSNVFQSVAKKNIYVENYMYKVAIERFSNIMKIMEQVLFTNVEKRLAMFLFAHADENKTIKMTHHQIAHNIGSVREVVSRILKSFANNELISLERGKITILDPKRLKDIY